LAIKLYIRTTLVARATLPLSATPNKKRKKRRSTDYGKLQHDVDRPEVLTQGETSVS